ncbi:MAG: hypothetical protein EHM32_05165 [Spirochaetales bacterium]|nr:MAG: hypothetical protein EHM32_05165 [Spirochaetales bacterium]
MKNKLALIIALVWIGSTACSTIDIAITNKVDVNKKLNKVAVFPFDVKGAGWGDEFSDSISHCFFKTGRVEVVEREALERILKEQNLSMTGLIDDKSAVKVGKLLGADVILVGRGSALRAYEGEGKSLTSSTPSPSKRSAWKPATFCSSSARNPEENGPAAITPSTAAVSRSYGTGTTSSLKARDTMISRGKS